MAVTHSNVVVEVEMAVEAEEDRTMALGVAVEVVGEVVVCPAHVGPARFHSDWECHHYIELGS